MSAVTAARHPVWGDLLDPKDAAHLDPGLPEQLERHPDVLVVGGGMIGVAIAERCERAGLGEVVLLEATTLGAGATGGAAGLLIPDAHQGSEPDWFVDLARESLALWRDLQQRHDVGLVELDWISLEPQPPDLDPPPSSEALTASEVAAIAPGLNPPSAGLRLPNQGRVNPLLALARMSRTRAWHRHGCGRDRGAHAPRAHLRSHDLRRVVHARRGHLRHRGTAGVARTRSHARPAMDQRTPPRDRARTIRFPGAVAPVATRLDDGRLLVGGTLDLNDSTPTVDDHVVATIKAGLDHRLPEAAPLAITHAWCCFRPAHPDRLPVLDRVPGLTNAWITSGHYRTGIVMAPITADLLTNWIHDGTPPPKAAPLAERRPAHPG